MFFYYSLWYQRSEQIMEEDIKNYSSTVMFPSTFPTLFDQPSKLILYLISITVTSSNTATTITCSFPRWPASNTAATLPAIFNLDLPPILLTFPPCKGSNKIGLIPALLHWPRKLLLPYLLFSTLTSLQSCCYSTCSYPPWLAFKAAATLPALLHLD